MLSWSMGTRRVLGLFTCLVVLSCQAPPKLSDTRTVNNSEEVANVFVSAYPAVAWTDIAELLQPKHALTTTDARNLAAVTTQAQVSQFLSTFAAGLAIGLPSKTSSTTTTLAGDGTTTTTGTRNATSGAVPAASAVTPLALTDANLAPDLARNPLGQGVDATTQLMAGTSVFQLAQILDNQITKALPLKGYQGYLVTFQVNLQPFSRNLPYDAYLNLTLMPASWAKAAANSSHVAQSADALSPIIVYPLVVADALESSSVGHSIEVIRQAALSLSGIVSSVGVKGDLAGSSDRLDSILGSDRNSLVTVGRISDHSLRIRLGAQQQGSRQLALVPRTQNISVVVFTRVGESSETHLNRLAVITEVSFVDAHTGLPVPSQRNTDEGRAKLKEQVNSTIAAYDYEFNPTCAQQGYDSLDLLRSLDRGDYTRISECLQTQRAVLATATPAAPAASAAPGTAKTLAALLAFAQVPASAQPQLTPAEESRLRRVVAGLMTVQTNSRFAKLTIPLKEYSEIVPIPPDPAQLVLFTDDKTALKAVLRGGANLTRDSVVAKLVVTPNKQKVTLLPTALDIDASGKTISVSFPSLVGNNLLTVVKSTDPKVPDSTSDPLPMRLEIAYVATPVPTSFAQPASYELRVVKSEPEPPASPVSVLSSVLVPDAAGTAKVTVVVGEWDSKKLGPLALRLAGADLRGIDPPTPFDPKLKAIPLAGASLVTLTLAHLNSAQAIQLQPLVGKAALGKPIALTLAPPAAAGK